MKLCYIKYLEDNMKVNFKKCNDEFMLLPNFNIDSWFNYTTLKWERVTTIGWLFWFVRFIKEIKK